MDFSKLLEWVKAPTTTVFALAIGSGLILLASDSALANVGLDDGTVGQYWWVRDALAGGIFVFSVPLLLTRFGAWIATQVRQRVNARQAEKNLAFRIQNLSGAEKSRLRDFIRRDSRSNRYANDDPVVPGMVSEELLYVPRLQKLEVHSRSYQIQTWVWDYLVEHPDAIDPDPD